MKYFLGLDVGNSTVKAVIIDVASMYENTQTILNLFDSDVKTPSLSLNFERTRDISSKVKLKSFCYYI